MGVIKGDTRIFDCTSYRTLSLGLRVYSFLHGRVYSGEERATLQIIKYPSHER